MTFVEILDLRAHVLLFKRELFLKRSLNQSTLGMGVGMDMGSSSSVEEPGFN